MAEGGCGVDQWWSSGEALDVVDGGWGAVCYEVCCGLAADGVFDVGGVECPCVALGDRLCGRGGVKAGGSSVPISIS